MFGGLCHDCSRSTARSASPVGSSGIGIFLLSQDEKLDSPAASSDDRKVRSHPRRLRPECNCPPFFRHRSDSNGLSGLRAHQPGAAPVHLAARDACSSRGYRNLSARRQRLSLVRPVPAVLVRHLAPAPPVPLVLVRQIQVRGKDHAQSCQRDSTPNKIAGPLRHSLMCSFLLLGRAWLAHTHY